MNTKAKPAKSTTAMADMRAYTLHPTTTVCVCACVYVLG